jgi:hypothetical protein
MRIRIPFLALAPALSVTSGWASAVTLPGPAFADDVDRAAHSAACSANTRHSTGCARASRRPSSSKVLFEEMNQ